MSLQAHEIPTVVIVNDEMNRTKGISTNVIYNDVDDDTTEIFVDFSLYNVECSLLIDLILEYISKNTKGSYNNIDNKVVTKELECLSKNTLVNILVALYNTNLKSIKAELYLTGYLQTILIDTITSLRVNLGKIPMVRDVFTELYIYGVKYYNTKVDVVCSALNSVSLMIEVNQGNGKLVRIPTDVFTTDSKTPWLDSDVFSTCSGISYINTETEVQSGKLLNVDVDVFSTRLGIDGINTDFKTRSLFIGDFFIEQDRFTTASSIAWVDVVDYLYPINTYATYIEVNGVVASGIWFEDIPNGKRVFYDPLDDFYSTGVLTYSLHVESIIGEAEDKNFYLLYGYNVVPNEVIDWGPNNNVVVRLEAQNLVFCPNKESKAFEFSTVDLKSFNLPCTIFPVGYVDLSMAIFPQSTVFYYGKTYTIKLKNVKDFAGNIMPDFEYTFTIEAPVK